MEARGLYLRDDVEDWGRRMKKSGLVDRKERQKVKWMVWWNCIAPSRLTGEREKEFGSVSYRSVPRWFISCRNAGPFLHTLPTTQPCDVTLSLISVYPHSHWIDATGTQALVLFLPTLSKVLRDVLETLGIAMKDILPSHPCPRLFLKSLFWMHFSLYIYIFPFSNILSPSPSTLSEVSSSEHFIPFRFPSLLSHPRILDNFLFHGGLPTAALRCNSQSVVSLSFSQISKI